MEYIVKNGIYIHVVHLALLSYLNVQLSTMIALKLYSVNYFYWFGTEYTFFPRYPRLNWIKQFIRFTDTGHFASLLVYCYPSFFPLVHNVHFLIMIGYLAGKILFQMKDADRITSSSLSEVHMDMLTYIHHILPYVLMVTLYPSEHRVFTCETMIQTFAWLYTWFICIYLPWRFVVGDPVYSVLDERYTSPNIMLSFCFVIHLLVFLSNAVGYLVFR